MANKKTYVRYLDIIWAHYYHDEIIGAIDQHWLEPFLFSYLVQYAIIRPGRQRSLKWSSDDDHRSYFYYYLAYYYYY